MYPQASYKQQASFDPYLHQKITSANPNQLIAYIYDVGIAACTQKNRGKARQAIFALMDALNWENKEIAANFYNVYRYLNRLVSSGKFSEAKKILDDVRKTWSKAMQVV
jgi:flagellin-specific chaperone FliS